MVKQLHLILRQVQALRLQFNGKKVQIVGQVGMTSLVKPILHFPLQPLYLIMELISEQDGQFQAIQIIRM